MANKKLFGIVEGFFSEPLPYWTHKERLLTIKFIAKKCPHFNAYFYNPKNDLLVKEKPFSFYSIKKMNEFKETIALCEKNKMVFIYGFNPVFDIKLIEKNFESYILLISKKMEQMVSIGVKNFCILYDEIPFAMNFVDKKISDKNAGHTGMVHALIINSILEKFSERIERLWFCPSDYSFVKKNQYLQELFEKMDNSVSVIWTGDGIFTKQITSGMIQKVQQIVGKKRRLIYWDNYPVNDCFHALGVMHIGAFNAPKPGAEKKLKGIFINPMRECFSNFIAYLTFEKYLSDLKAGKCVYDRGKAMAAAFETLFEGENVWQSYLRICETFANKNVADDAPKGYFKKLMSAASLKEVQKILDSINRDLASFSIPTNFFAKKFVESVKPVINRAKIFNKIFFSILCGGGWREDFFKNDSFPVVLHKKYLNVYLRIFKGRAALIYDLCRQRFTPFNDGLKMLENLHKKYKNRNKLSITRRDEKLLLETLERLISLERQYFLKCLNGLIHIKKIRAIILRSLINGY